MTPDFEPAVRTNTAFIGALCGPSGSGKTKSALLIASGLSPSGSILVKDSEGGRALHYAPDPGQQPDYVDTFRFAHELWEPPYTPESLGTALRNAESRGFEVIVVDSASSEHEDEGGLMDMAEAQLQIQKDRGWELNNVTAWAQPKAEHKHHIVRWLRRTRCHVIFCCRAQEKLSFEKGPRGKTVIVPLGFSPVCEKNLLYDVTTSMLFTIEARGVPKPIKIYRKHEHIFPLDRPISRETGVALAAWCYGASPPETAENLIRAQAREEALAGLSALETFWARLTPSLRKSLGREFLDELKALAPIHRPEFTEADRRASYDRAGVPLEEPKQQTSADDPPSANPPAVTQPHAAADPPAAAGAIPAPPPEGAYLSYALPMVMTKSGKPDLRKWAEVTLLTRLLQAKTAVECAMIQGDNHQHIAAYKATLQPLQQLLFEGELARIAEELAP